MQFANSASEILDGIRKNNDEIQPNLKFKPTKKNSYNKATF